jgi:hypothetical protein
MATDSTELTFVRCPSCRSLVPAVSTRCRMCGATLDATAADEGDKEKKSGRVRQRTMSAPDSELSATASQVREEAPPPPPPSSSGASAATDLEDDPLGDYLDSIDEVPAVRAETPPAPAKPAAPPPPPAAPPVTAPVTESRSTTAADIDLDDDLDIESAPRESAERPKVVVETGGRRPFGQGKPGGLSFSRPREDRPRDERPREEVKPVAARPAQPPPPAPPRAPSPPPERAEPQSREVQPKRPESRPEPRREERREERPRETASQAQPHGGRPAQPQARASESSRRVESAAGRLYGWLVSYADPDGKSIELREGKFFVTGNSLKESDLIVNDKSISTPHALVSVGGETGLRIQDLMSDRGVFLRHGESGAYQRREEPCTVEHGDWVRFGDVEFLVCLIAYPGVR